MTTLSSSQTSAARSPSTAQRFVIDASHSSVGFSVRHMMITNVKGEFQKFEGELQYDPRSPETAKISASIEVASINTREEKRDAHLRSADFFDAETYPSIRFDSTRVSKKGEDLEVIGDLTIHGTTRQVSLNVSDLTAEHTDPWGNRRIGASAKTKVRRSEFGMQWNAALEAGGVLVGDEVTISIDVSLVRSAAVDA
jgi:polyisoprenoid-binding protein YceI